MSHESRSPYKPTGLRGLRILEKARSLRTAATLARRGGLYDLSSSCYSDKHRYAERLLEEARVMEDVARQR